MLVESSCTDGIGPHRWHRLLTAGRCQGSSSYERHRMQGEGPSAAIGLEQRCQFGTGWITKGREL